MASFAERRMGNSGRLDVVDSCLRRNDSGSRRVVFGGAIMASKVENK